VLQVLVTETEKRVLGKEHPSTMKSLANLEFMRRKQDSVMSCTSQ